MDPTHASIRCSHCGDRKIKLRPVSKGASDPFGYRFSPAFPPKPITLDDLPILPEDYVKQIQTDLSEKGFLSRVKGEFPPSEIPIVVPIKKAIVVKA